MVRPRCCSRTERVHLLQPRLLAPLFSVFGRTGRIIDQRIDVFRAPSRLADALVADVADRAADAGVGCCSRLMPCMPTDRGQAFGHAAPANDNRPIERVSERTNGFIV
jgi:hypothetical protein